MSDNDIYQIIRAVTNVAILNRSSSFAESQWHLLHNAIEVAAS